MKIISVNLNMYFLKIKLTFKKIKKMIDLKFCRAFSVFACKCRMQKMPSLINLKFEHVLTDVFSIFDCSLRELK